MTINAILKYKKVEAEAMTTHDNIKA